MSYIPQTAIGERSDDNWSVLQADLSKLNKLDTISLCIKLNLLTSDKKPADVPTYQMKALALLYQDGLIDRISAQRVQEALLSAHAEGLHPLAFNRAGLLEMIRWATIYSTSAASGNLKHLSHLRKSFIRALLTCAEVYGRREIAPGFPSGVTADEKQIAFALTARRGGMFGGAVRDPLLTLGRTELLFVDNFLNKNPEYMQTFERIYGMSVDDWMSCNTAMLLTGFDINNLAVNAQSFDGQYEWHPDRVCAEAQSLKASFNRFIDNLGQSIEELASGFGNVSLNGDQTFQFRQLRQKPILKLSDGRFMIIDRNLFLEAMSVGPVFAINAATKSGQALQRYGDACEMAAFQIIKSANDGLSQQNQSPHVILNPPSTAGQLTDVLVGSSETAALFEVKGVWLKEELLQKSPAEFINAVIEKYAAPSGVTSSGEKQRPKGMGQLAAAIKGLNDGTLTALDGAAFVNSVSEIIPVLVVQDAMITEPTMCNRLSREFSALLGQPMSETGNTQYGRFTLHNAIVLNFFDIEALEAAQLDCSVTEFLKQYSERSPDRRVDFKQFWNDRRKMFHARDPLSQLIRGTAIRRLDRVQQQCFGTQNKILHGNVK